MVPNTCSFITVDIHNSVYYIYYQYTRRASVSHAYFGGFFFLEGEREI